ncbi:biotin-dependent carboxyltransferase family protein [Kangiella sp. HZ709]|uniref:5-oxoprolinase subunit C family protein n=1 Tax=Kangiella sp. HZ709 TaxID=2666328 RepID=UPI0012AFAB0B|nr:biotin-dependent carboxyltransferase family protein [Kangiella sp. HZ709]MRX27557.1 5-oxoprolinase/urea amidolyase family protein [Kangiella sp. HZ709]
MSIKVLKPGLQTSIQDLGRSGFRHLGVSQAGAIDSYHLKLANWLVSKPLDSACIESYLIGPVIEFQSNMTIAITGAEFEMYLNNTPISNNRSYNVHSSDRLEFGKLISGARAYIAFSAALNCQTVMTCYSSDTTSGIAATQTPTLSVGEIISTLDSIDELPIRTLPKELVIPNQKNIIVRVIKGLEYSRLTKKSKQILFESTFKVDANSNRMGLRLNGEHLELKEQHEMVSSPIVHGTIQLPKSGQPIIALNEGQTIGGYPRVAQVISADLHLLGQAAPNSKISFYPITIDKAATLQKHKTDFLKEHITYF